jgi:hypothetical protein
MAITHASNQRSPTSVPQRDRFGQFANHDKPFRAPRLFEETLRRAIAQDDGQRLRKSIEKLLTEAARGKPWAIAMLADRLDGKVLPQLPDTGDGQLVISWIIGPAQQPATVDITPEPTKLQSTE